MKIDMTGDGNVGFKMKKGVFGCGMLITFLVPMAASPLFIFVDEIENMLSIPSAYSGSVFIAGIVLICAGSLLGLAMIVGAILIPLFSMMGAKNEVLTNGIPAVAKILTVTDTGTRINHNPLVSFMLEVRPTGEQSFNANVNQPVSVIHLPSYQMGQMVNVKYSPGTNEVAIVGLKSGQS